jgi:hypothetical protein
VPSRCRPPSARTAPDDLDTLAGAVKTEADRAELFCYCSRQVRTVSLSRHVTGAARFIGAK